MDDWIDYYDSTHTIYVSKLHRDVHFRVIAAQRYQVRPSWWQRWFGKGDVRDGSMTGG